MTAARAFRFGAQIQALAFISQKPLPYFADTKLIPLARIAFHARYERI
jgi:hypothetical protein